MKWLYDAREYRFPPAGTDLFVDGKQIRHGVAANPDKILRIKTDGGLTPIVHPYGTACNCLKDFTFDFGLGHHPLEIVEGDVSFRPRKK